MNQRIPCAAVLAVIVLAGAPAFAVENKDVRVVNTPAERVPVDATGTVALAQGTQVGVAGPVTLTPDTQVSLTPGTEVGVANTAANPLHVVTPAAGADIFVGQGFFEFPPELVGSGEAFITIPPNKRLVIEQVAARLFGSAGLTVDFAFDVRSSGGPEAHFDYPAEGRNTPGSLNYRHILSAPLRAYHDGDRGPLRVRVLRSSDSVPIGAMGRAIVSGYLIDLP